MDLMTYLTGFVAGLCVVIIIKRIQFLRKLPPGPWSCVPILGQLIHLNRNNAIDEFQKWRKAYGNIFSYSMGNFYVIVLNDYKIILDALKRDEFLGRPEFQSWIGRNHGIKNRGILFSDGVHSWSEQRRFALKTLRDFGFGKESMEGLLQHELKELVNRLKKEGANKNAIEMSTAFNASVFNSLWHIVAGKRFELDDPEFLQLLEKMQGHLKTITFTSPGSFYPWPVQYNLVKKGVWQRMERMYTDILDMMNGKIQNHLDTYEDNQTRDFIDAFIHETKSRKDDKSSFSSSQWRDHLQVLLLDLFSAGTETTSTTLLWALLYMTKFPGVQRKLHDEVDEVLGKNKLPARDDRQNMPYVEAFTNEVHRKCSLLPMSVYHAMQQDLEYEGYFLPKGAVVFPNLYECHHDKAFWGDPEKFRVERFLDPSGTKVVKKEALMAFSAGKRICLGETLARDTLFIFLTGLLQEFSFELDDSSKNYDFMNEKKPMFVVSPDAFKIILHPRN